MCGLRWDEIIKMSKVTFSTNESSREEVPVSNRTVQLTKQYGPRTLTLTLTHH
jgi:hypothetical protein